MNHGHVKARLVYAPVEYGNMSIPTILTPNVRWTQSLTNLLFGRKRMKLKFLPSCNSSTAHFSI